MDLSISSSKPRIDRSAIVLALAFCLTIMACGLNAYIPDPEYTYKRNQDRFWINKAHKDSGIDVILSGDSRVYRGLSPAAFEAVLQGSDVFNYGFSSGGHNPLIFGEIDRMLSKDKDRPRTVVLGITPWSLTGKAQENEQYLQYKRRPANSIPENQTLEDLLRPLKLGRVKDIARGETSELPGGVTNDFLPDGWVRSDWAKRDPDSAIASYDHGFDDNRVEQHVIDGIMHQTEIWTAQGITVIGYRPPTTPAMVRLENEKSGFDEAAFVRAFRKAGGIWVELPDDFESYDGSHLTPESTEKLSKILAGRIARSHQTP